MDFIEVKNGISINIDSIEAIIEINDEKKPTTKSMIYTAANSYPSELPRLTLLELISNNECIPSTNLERS